MAAVTAAVVVGAGTLLSVYGAIEQGKAAKKAGELNARDAEENARLSQAQSDEDARQFRLSFRRDNAKNVAAVAASGIKMEGSPLEVLQDNAAGAERDYQHIKAGGAQQRDSYLRQAQMAREGGKAAGRAATIAGAASLLKGAGETYTAGTKSGAWS